jgi:hypothetical protein
MDPTFLARGIVLGFALAAFGLVAVIASGRAIAGA